MKLLVLGGTRFLGRHLVDAALARGHDVTIFTRGVQPVPWGERGHASRRQPRPAHRARIGGARARANGTPRSTSSGYVPRCVGASAAALEGRVGHYTFVSSLSVYADASRPGRDETTPVVDARRSRDRGHRRRTTARSRRAARTKSARRSGVGRSSCAPGSSSARIDPTDRFAYWVARFVCPEALGARRRGGRAGAAGSRRPVHRRARSRDRGCSTWRSTRGRRHVRRVQLPRARGRWARSSTRSLQRRARQAARPWPQWIDDDALLRHERHAVDRAAAVDSRVRRRVGGLHGVHLRAGGSARPRVRPLRRRSTTRRRGFASATLRRVAQRAFRGEGTRDAADAGMRPSAALSANRPRDDDHASRPAADLTPSP